MLPVLLFGGNGWRKKQANNCLKMKIIKSFAFAWNGFKICFTSEANFKVHVFFALLATSLGFILKIGSNEWLAVIGCIALVTTMEMMNTALEKLCDVVQTDIHPGIKKVKDIAAGGVMIAAACSLIIGAVIFLPKIIYYIKAF